MNIVVQIEHRASSSRGKHEGESSFGLCDRLSRTRDNSQRQLPTDQDYAVSTREYQTDQSSLKTAPTAARSVLEKRRKQRQQQTHRLRWLTRSLHIRPMHSSRPRPVRNAAWRFAPFQNHSYEMRVYHYSNERSRTLVLKARSVCRRIFALHRPSTGPVFGPYNSDVGILLRYRDSSNTSIPEMVAKFAIGSKVMLSFPCALGFRW
jgi:hypothetical protein